MNKKTNYPTFAFICRRPAYFCAFGLGSGLLRPASGTWGTLAALGLALPFLSFLQNIYFAAPFLLCAFMFGVDVCTKTSRALGIHDHGGIVWDEFVAMWLVLSLMPAAFMHSVYAIIGAFLAFRFFDIGKPFPINWLDKNTRGGFGIMIDDIVAAVYALGFLWFIFWFKGQL